MDRPIFSRQECNYYDAKQKDIHDAEWYIRTNITYYKDKVVWDCRAQNASIEAYDMSNTDNCTNYYNINVKKVKAKWYINKGIVKGTFDNVFFSCSSNGVHTFWDCCTFKDCSFINCHFDEIDIRWCVFDKCQFVGCTGTIQYIRASKFKNCSFSSDIEIEQVDEYFIVNKERHKDGYMKLCE